MYKMPNVILEDKKHKISVHKSYYKPFETLTHAQPDKSKLIQKIVHLPIHNYHKVTPGHWTVNKAKGY